MLRHDLDGDILYAGPAPSATAASRAGGQEEVASSHRPIRPARAAQGQVAEHEPVTSVCFRIGEQTLLLQTTGRRHRGMPSGPASGLYCSSVPLTRSFREKPHGIGLDSLVCGEQNLDLPNAGFGREIERSQGPRLAGTLCIEADRFIAPARPHFVAVGLVIRGCIKIRCFLVAEADVIPVIDTAAADPDGIPLSRGCDNGPRPVRKAPTEAARIGENAGDAADGFALFRLRVRDRASGPRGHRVGRANRGRESSAGRRDGYSPHVHENCGARVPGGRRYG